MRKWLAAILLVVCCQHAQAWNKHGYVPGNGAVVLDLNGGGTGPMFLNLFKQGNCSAPIPTQFTNNFYPNGVLTTAAGCGLATNPALGISTFWTLSFNGAAALQLSARINLSTYTDPDGCVYNFNTIIQTNPAAGCIVTFQTQLPTNGSFLITFPITVNSVNVNYQNFSNAILSTQANYAAVLSCADVVCFDPNYLGVLSSTAGIQLGGASVNPLAVRSLDLQGISNGNQSGGGASYPASGMMTAASLNYNTQPYFPNLWGGTICATSGACAGSPSANQYIGPNSPDDPGSCQDGMIYQGSVADAGTSSPAPTLTANGCSAPVISLPTGGYSVKIPSIAAAFDTFTYSAVLGEWIYTNSGLHDAWPPEVLAALCNAIHSDCWIQLPTEVDLASVTAITQKIAAELKPGLKWYVEWSNELFGSFTQQTLYVYTAGIALGFPNTGSGGTPLNDYDALRRYQIMQAVDAAWTGAGRSQSDLVRMQIIESIAPTFSPVSQPNIDIQSLLFAGHDLTLDTNGDYTTGTGGGCAGSCLPIVTNYSTVGVRPGDVMIDGLSYAPYLNGILGVWSDCGVYGNGPSIYATAIADADLYAEGTTAPGLAFVDADIRGPSTCAGTQFTATLSNSTNTGAGNVLNVSSVATGTLPIAVGNIPIISGSGIPANTWITADGAAGCTPAGTGETGCYTVSTSTGNITSPENMSMGSNGQLWTATICNAACNGPGTVMTVSSVEVGNLHVSSNLITGSGVSPQNTLSAFGASGCSPAGTGSNGCYTVSIAQYIPTPETMGTQVNGQTVFFQDASYAQYDTMLQNWPNVKGTYEYEGGIQEAGPFNGIGVFLQLGLLNSPNCPTTTSTPTVTFTTSGSLVNWTASSVPTYSTIVFSQSGGAITAGVPYYTVIDNANSFKLTNILGSSGSNITFNGSEISPQTATYSDTKDSMYCLDQEFIAMIEGYKYTAAAATLINNAWTTFMSYGSSKAPAWYSLGLGGTSVGTAPNAAFPPQWELVLGSVYSLPYYQTFYGVSAWSAAHPAYPYLLKRDLDPASNDNSPAFLDQAA